MGMREKFLLLKTRLNEYPEVKMKIMWLLDRVPIVKEQLKKINHIETRREIETIDDLSLHAQEIYRQIKARGL